MAETTTAAGQGDTTTAAETTAATTTETTAATTATATATAAATQNDTATAATTDTTAAATVPDKYELTVPEGAAFDASDLEAISAEAKAFGLTNDQAQALVQVRAEQIATTSQKWLTDLTADKDLGGDHLPMTQQLARAGRDYVFPPGTPGADLVRGWFDKTGLGNHPEFVRAMVRIGKQMAEDRPHTGGGASQNTVKDAATVLYGTTA